MANKAQPCIIALDRIDLFSFIGALKKHKQVKVTGLGIFYLKHVNKRSVYIPGTTKKVTIKSRNKITFSPTQKLKDQLV